MIPSCWWISSSLVTLNRSERKWVTGFSRNFSSLSPHTKKRTLFTRGFSTAAKARFFNRFDCVKYSQEDRIALQFDFGPLFSFGSAVQSLLEPYYRMQFAPVGGKQNWSREIGFINNFFPLLRLFSTKTKIIFAAVSEKCSSSRECFATASHQKHRPTSITMSTAWALNPSATARLGASSNHTQTHTNRLAHKTDAHMLERKHHRHLTTTTH